MPSLRNHVIEYIRERYAVELERPWFEYPESIVFRHKDNAKWFALVMDVRRGKLGLAENADGADAIVDVLNVKLGDDLLRSLLLRQPGYLPGYHMNKQHWTTVLLDGTVSAAEVEQVIDLSFAATASAAVREVRRGPKEWLVPSNPKYYDVVGAFAARDEIEWKQGAGIRTGDTVYLYVGAPVSAILFACEVGETNIPYDYSDGNLRIKALMKIRLLRRYEPDEFTFARLSAEYGVHAVRGPRGVPNSLSEDLKR